MWDELKSQLKSNIFDDKLQFIRNHKRH